MISNCNKLDIPISFNENKLYINQTIVKDLDDVYVSDFSESEDEFDDIDTTNNDNKTITIDNVDLDIEFGIEFDKEDSPNEKDDLRNMMIESVIYDGTNHAKI